MFVDVLGMTIILPLLPFYAENLGASAQQVGYLVACYAACQLLASPIIGKLSDRFGRKKLLIISQLGTLAGFILLAFSTSLWMVFLSRVIDGLTAGNISLAQASVVDVTEPKDRARSFGIIGIAFGSGFFIGPAISGFFVQFGYHYPMIVACLMSATSIVATSLILPQVRHAPPADQPQGQSQLKRVLNIPSMKILFVLFFFFAFAFGGYTSGLALFAERLMHFKGHPFGASDVGYIFTFSGLLGIFVQGKALGYLVEKWGEGRLALVGFVCMSSGYLLLLWLHSFPSFLIAITISSFGSGVTRPALTTIITHRVARHEQGFVLGLNQSLQSVAQITAPILGALIIDRGYAAEWPIMCAVFAFLGVLFGVRTLQKK